MQFLFQKKFSVLKLKFKREFDYYYGTSRPKKILFDHLPKCGGSSLNLYLEAHYPRKKIFSTIGSNPMASVELFKALPQYKRYDYDLVIGHLAHELLNYVDPEHLTITVLRDPVDRIISHYYYAKRTTGHYLYSKIHEEDLNLEEYATSDLSDELRNWYTTHFSGLTISDAESDPEAAVAKAVKFLMERYDIIGFLDEFEVFSKILKEQAGFKNEYKNLRVNVSTNRPPIDSISQSTIRKIQAVNYLDIVFYRKIREAIGRQSS